MRQYHGMPSEPALPAFATAFARAALDGSLASVVLSKPRPGSGDLRRVELRPVALRGEQRIAIVHRHATRDLTRHASVVEAADALRGWLDAGDPTGPEGGAAFGHATLRTAGEEWQLLSSRKGRQSLVRRPVGPVGGTGATRSIGGADRPTAGETPPAAKPHDRDKRRWVPIDAPWLEGLGVTDAAHRLVPSMARKWKQIDKFVEIFDAAWRRSPLAGAATMTVVDFGCGKGYLTFAVFDHLRRAGVEARVTGVELRADLVEAANRLAARVGAEGLSFVAGDLRAFTAAPMDAMVALHACDTATDHALALGVAAGAGLLFASPCCHKELRPQLGAGAAGAGLAPLLRHGIHLGQQAEMLTDTLRILALEAGGYEAGVSEFVSLEHTSKNKLIVATRRADPALAAARAGSEIEALERFWGIREQCLVRLLRERSAAVPAPT